MTGTTPTTPVAADTATRPRSAATDIWRVGRAIGAPSPGAYRDALETGMLLDQGQAALDRVVAVRADGSTTLAGALAALADAKTVQQSVVAADRRLRRMRRRVRFDPFTVTPPAPSSLARRRITRLTATTGAFDADTNPLVGDLAGTTEAARRALVEREPLFSDGTISSATASVELGEVADLIAELHRCLVEGFTAMTSGTPLARRIIRRLRRFAPSR